MTHDGSIGEGEWLPPCRQHLSVVPGADAANAPDARVVGLPDPGLKGEGAYQRANSRGDEWGGDQRANRTAWARAARLRGGALLAAQSQTICACGRDKATQLCVPPMVSGRCP